MQIIVLSIRTVIRLFAAKSLAPTSSLFDKFLSVGSPRMASTQRWRLDVCPFRVFSVIRTWDFS
jgi:hypothetical protein